MKIIAINMLLLAFLVSCTTNVRDKGSGELFTEDLVEDGATYIEGTRANNANIVIRSVLDPDSPIQFIGSTNCNDTASANPNDVHYKENCIYSKNLSILLGDILMGAITGSSLPTYHNFTFGSSIENYDFTSNSGWCAGVFPDQTLCNASASGLSTGVNRVDAFQQVRDINGHCLLASLWGAPLSDNSFPECATSESDEKSIAKTYMENMGLSLASNWDKAWNSNYLGSYLNKASAIIDTLGSTVTAFDMGGGYGAGVTLFADGLEIAQGGFGGGFGQANNQKAGGGAGGGISSEGSVYGGGYGTSQSFSLDGSEFKADIRKALEIDDSLFNDIYAIVGGGTGFSASVNGQNVIQTGSGFQVCISFKGDPESTTNCAGATADSNSGTGAANGAGAANGTGKLLGGLFQTGVNVAQNILGTSAASDQAKFQAIMKHYICFDGCYPDRAPDYCPKIFSMADPNYKLPATAMSQSVFCQIAADSE